MSRRTFLKELIGGARPLNDLSILSTKELQAVIDYKYKDQSYTRRQALRKGHAAGPLSRREFLKAIGVLGVGGVVAATGLQISERELQSLTGRPTAGEDGMNGSSGSAKKLTVASGDNEVIDLSDGETLENMLIDITADGASVKINARASDWEIRNVGIKGVHPGQENILFPQVTQSGSTGLVENFYLGDGAEQGSKGGIYVPSSPDAHKGELTFRGIHVAHISNNGLYGSSPGYKGQQGLVHVVQSYFYSNNISNIRLGGPGGTSHVEKNTVKVDNTVPPCRMNCSSPGATKSRGVWAWAGDVQVKDSNIQGNPPLTTKGGGNIMQDNVQTGSSADDTPPDGVPMSAEEAACLNS